MKQLNEMEFNFEVDAPEIGETVWIDIETKKVDAPDGWGYKKRWSCFMACVANFDNYNNLRVTILYGDESLLINRLKKRLDGFCQIEYSGTRQFDEMVLKGRFTNARRALSPVPGEWANLDLEPFDWKNIWNELKGKEVNRASDIESKFVPDAWKKGQTTIVLLHCLRDVLEMIAGKFGLGDFERILEDNLFGFDLFY